MLRDLAFAVLGLQAVIWSSTRRARRRGLSSLRAVRLTGLRNVLVGAALLPLAVEATGWLQVLWLPAGLLLLGGTAQLLVPEPASLWGPAGRVHQRSRSRA